MTRQTPVRKRGFQALTRLSSPDGHLDALAFASRSHLLICLTAVVGARREVVGIELQPIPKNFDAATWPERPSGIRKRLEAALATYREFPIETLAPVPAELLRDVTLRDVMAFRQVDVADRLRMRGVIEQAGGTSSLGRGDLGATDEKRLAYLDDALLYVRALAEGFQPAEAIAQERGISKRTAEGRIARARTLGLLSRAEGRTASGHLTSECLRLVAWVDARVNLREKEKERSDG